MITIIPAIDLIDGSCVRLTQGDYDRKTTYYKDPLDVARRYEDCGIKRLHLVDLDGAKAGRRVNDQIITQVASSLSIPVEIGGGIRTMDDIVYYIEHGVERVILGTSAMEDEELLKNAVARYGSHIAVGIDCKNGYVYGRGWLEGSTLYYIDFAKYLEKIGVQTVIVTDITKDGTLKGPNLEMLQKLKEAVRMQIVASGGVKDLDDIKALRDMGLYGAITGKAMVYGTLDLKQALECCRED